MTRWLEAARGLSDLGKEPKKPKKPQAGEVNSVNSVFSETREGFAGDPRARLDAARARVARLLDADGIARTDAAIEAVWAEAEALAAVRESAGVGAPSILTATDR